MQFKASADGNLPGGGIMADIKNIVILGDSMSDIGNKWLTPSGQLGRLAKRMRVNETGRFSDGRNWTDFLVEWSTGVPLMFPNRGVAVANSTLYRTLTGTSVLHVSPWNLPGTTVASADYNDPLKYIAAWRDALADAETLPPIRYANYAEGGCIVTTDWTPKYGMLTYLRGQVEQYIAQRKAEGEDEPFGATMHIIWIGLNDFVTAKRPDYTPGTAGVPAANDYQAWFAWSQANPQHLKGGEGVFPAVAEIKSLIDLIDSNFPADKKDNHFMVIDLPSVYNAIRYIEGFAKSDNLQEAQEIQPVLDRYNAMLADLVQKWPADENAPAEVRVRLVDMSTWMDYISENLDAWELSRKPQDPGVQVFYGRDVRGEQDPVPPEMRNRITTSDMGHPTEAVYRIIARYVVTKLLQNGHTLGRLDSMKTWQQRAPLGDLPLDPPTTING